MIKKVITIFFLLVFTTQVLPVKQVGRIFFQSSMTEELPEKAPSKSTVGFVDDCKHVLYLHFYNNSFFSNSVQSIYIHFSETLPGITARELLKPPPDFS